MRGILVGFTCFLLMSSGCGSRDEVRDPSSGVADGGGTASSGTATTSPPAGDTSSNRGANVSSAVSGAAGANAGAVNTTAGGHKSEAVLLPILTSDVELKNGKYVIRARTKMPTTGWKVELRPVASEDEEERQYELVGYPPIEPSDQIEEEREVAREEDFPKVVTTVTIKGKDDMWAVDGVPSKPESEETPDGGEGAEGGE